ncbi:MAG: glutathione S-transferase [Planctomycetota bacterium]
MTHSGSEEFDRVMAKRKLIVGNKNYSSWSLRGWLITTRAGVDFDEEVIPLHQDETRALRDSLSPTGLVPVLIDEDVAIWDSL